MRILAFFLLSLLPVSIFAEYFIIDRYQVNINVKEDGEIEIKETIDLSFSEERRGIIRTIPYKYDYNGKQIKIKISDVEVKNWNYKTYTENGDFKIRIGDADIFVDGSQQYIINYTVQNAYLWNDNVPEFYWNVIGPDWDVPIQHIQFDIQFPEDFEISNRAYTIFSGTEGSIGNKILLTRDGNTFHGESTEGFGKNEAVSFAVLLKEGSVEKYIWYKAIFKSDKYYPYGLGGLLLFFLFWREKGRNKSNSKNIPIHYTPPSGYNAAELGYFLDNKVSHSDLLSLIPEWGEKGYIHVSRSSNPDIDEKDAIIFEKISSLPSSAPKYQHTLFNGIFEKSSVRVLSELRNKVYVSLSKSSSQLVKYMREQELYDHFNLKLFHSGWMILLFFLCLIGGILLMAIEKQFISGILLIILGIMAFVIHFLRPKLSDKGRVLEEYGTSFKKFLETPNEQKVSELVRADNHYFDKLFPYALAFGLDNSWVRLFSKHQESAPAWYHDTDTNGYHRNTSFDQFSKQFQPKNIQSAFKSKPVSSSSSGSGGGGFSGGGSSGGGFGGGGGSSW